MRLLKKKYLHIGTICFGLTLALLMFTNAYDPLSTLKSDAAQMQSRIDDPKTPQALAVAYAKYKTMIVNAISGRIFARSCQELKFTEITLDSGNYIVYPTGDINDPHVAKCSVDGMRVTTDSLTRIDGDSCVTRGDCTVPQATEILLSGNQDFEHQNIGSPSEDGLSWRVPNGKSGVFAYGANIPNLKSGDYVASFVVTIQPKKGVRSNDRVAEFSVFNVTKAKAISTVVLTSAAIENPGSEMMVSIRFSNSDFKGDVLDFRSKAYAKADIELKRVLVLSDFEIPKLRKDQPILGKLESVSLEKGQVYAKGWACLSENLKPLEVQIYIGGEAGTGRWAASGISKENTSSSIRKSCKTPNSGNYGFRILIPKEVWADGGDTTVFVHAIHPTGLVNSLLADSGKYKAYTPPAVSTKSKAKKTYWISP